MKKYSYLIAVIAITTTLNACNCKNNKQTAENGMQQTENVAQQKIEDSMQTEQTSVAIDPTSSKFIDIEMPSITGKKIRLSNVVKNNKLTLLDFWASWCRPCMEELPNVAEAYKKYHNKGLEIVGISLDEDEKSWKQAVETMKLSWIQMSDLKDWDNTAARAYNINAIPTTILINQKGEIVATNLRGMALHKKLAEILE